MEADASAHQDTEEPINPTAVCVRCQGLSLGHCELSVHTHLPCHHCSTPISPPPCRSLWSTTAMSHWEPVSQEWTPPSCTPTGTWPPRRSPGVQGAWGSHGGPQRSPAGVPQAPLPSPPHDTRLTRYTGQASLCWWTTLRCCGGRPVEQGHLPRPLPQRCPSPTETLATTHTATVRQSTHSKPNTQES